MPYVRRDAAGRIVATSCEPELGCEELLAATDPELQAFLTQIGDGARNEEAAGIDEEGEGAVRELASTDLSFIRVLEDLIALLVTRNVIRFTDLPAAAQAKMLERQYLRDALQPHLDLLDDEREDPLI